MYIYIHVPVVKYINNIEIYNYVEVISTSVHVYIYKQWMFCNKNLADLSDVTNVEGVYLHATCYNFIQNCCLVYLQFTFIICIL